ncbi:hypothetical protein N7475_001088 [Penicillium sp. IBT 31633x]|nr:hypothetical protein N7475_001088 [Penicillium sp. IBT 31633x]
MMPKHHVWFNAPQVCPPTMSLTLNKPSHLSHEQYFKQECRLFQKAVLREAQSLHNLEGSRANSYQVICDLVVELEIIKRLAEIMTKKSPMCPTVLVSSKGYFSSEFQDICQTKILPPLRMAMASLQKSNDITCDINYTLATQLETVHDDMAMALDSRE